MVFLVDMNHLALFDDQIQQFPFGIFSWIFEYDISELNFMATEIGAGFRNVKWNFCLRPFLSLDIFNLHEGNLNRDMDTMLMEKKVSKLSISSMIVLRTSDMFMSRKIEVATTEILWSW
jgi:hypothetical protein